MSMAQHNEEVARLLKAKEANEEAADRWERGPISKAEQSHIHLTEKSWAFVSTLDNTDIFKKKKGERDIKEIDDGLLKRLEDSMYCPWCLGNEDCGCRENESMVTRTNIEKKKNNKEKKKEE